LVNIYNLIVKVDSLVYYFSFNTINGYLIKVTNRGIITIGVTILINFNNNNNKASNT